MTAQRAIVPAPVRQREPRQTPAERFEVYTYVTARDQFCRAPIIDPACSAVECRDWTSKPSRAWPFERHHAGNKIGGKRKTDARHVVLLCQYHHRTWAPSHSRQILEWLARIEDAR